MSLTVSEGGDFKPVPEGTHPARCVRLIDLGTQPGSQNFPTPQKKVLIGWELPDVEVEYDGEKRPALVVQRYTPSLHEKAKLRQHLEAWRNKRFTPEEKKGFELKKILGHPCLLTILHSEDGKYANVSAVASVPKGLIVPAAHHKLIHYEIEDGESDEFMQLSDKLRATIMQAPEWPGNLQEPAHDDEPPVGAYEDDQIPFMRYDPPGGC